MAGEDRRDTGSGEDTGAGGRAGASVGAGGGQGDYGGGWVSHLPGGRQGVEGGSQGGRQLASGNLLPAVGEFGLINISIDDIVNIRINDVCSKVLHDFFELIKSHLTMTSMTSLCH